LHLCTPVSCRNISEQEKKIARKDDEISKEREGVVAGSNEFIEEGEKSQEKWSTVGGNRSRKEGNAQAMKMVRKKNDMKFKCRGVGREGGGNVLSFAIPCPISRDQKIKQIRYRPEGGNVQTD
jgi:hypothetical protein